MKTAASLALWKRLRMHILTANGGSREFGLVIPSRMLKDMYLLNVLLAMAVWSVKMTLSSIRVVNIWISS